MWNEKLLNSVAEIKGMTSFLGIKEEDVNRLEYTLGVKLPNSYKRFLLRYGEGGVTGSYIQGIEDSEYSGAEEETLACRRNIGIDKSLIVISYGKKIRNNVICLDTSKMKNDECPVVEYLYESKEIIEKFKNFDEYFDAVSMELYKKATGFDYKEE